MNEPVPVEVEDVPAQIVRALPGVAFLTELTLEPIAAGGSARAFALRTAAAIARTSHGAVLDEQASSLTLPRGVKRYRPDPVTSVELLTLSWWWMGPQLGTVEGLGRFVDLLDGLVPESVPQRYGTYEPPEFKLAEQGRGHLVRFLHDHATELTVLYTSRPALGIALNLQEATGDGPYGFVANHLQLDFERDVLAQTGWESALRRLWREVSLLLEPFYGDVRMLGGYERRGSRLWVPRDAEEHPVDGPFWAGLPSGPALALVIGDPYSRLWSPSNARPDGGLQLATVESWNSSDDVFGPSGRPPDDLVDPREVSQRVPGSLHFGAMPVYPEGWPFR